MAQSLGNSTASRDIAYTLHPYTDLAAHETTGPLVLTRGKGIYVYDDEGREYIEGLAGLWCTSLGFGEERLAEAGARQLRRLPYNHGFAGRSTDVVIDLAETLIEMAPAPMAKAFFVNSGSEANDTQVKLAWYYNNAIGRPEKKKIIARRGGYHGVTVAAASLTGLPFVQNGFDLPIARILHTDKPHYWREAQPGESEAAFSQRLADNLEQLIVDEGPDTVAAFIAEPVMGAGGVVPPPAGYFAAIQKVLRKYDVLFIADEVITGFGRTGNMFATETYDLQPDMITVAKALSSGYVPIGACLISDKIYQGLRAGSTKYGVFGHGYTYSGHPVAAAIALETLRIYQERQIVDHVRTVAPALQDGLRRFADHPLIGDVRGVGLVAGLELVADKATKQPFDPTAKVAAGLVARAQAHGLMLRPLPGDVVAFCPPLIITAAEIGLLLERFEKALDETWTALEGT